MSETVEINYQEYIDALHDEIENYKVNLYKAELQLELYKEAICKAFLKWSDTE